MTCESVKESKVIQMSDTVPVQEAEREANQFEFSVNRGSFLGIVDSSGENHVYVRVKDSIKIFGKECHDGFESVVGNVRLLDGESYDVELGNKVVSILAGLSNGYKRDFIISVPDGMIIQTDDRSGK